MNSARCGGGNALWTACSRHGGRVLSISKFSCSAISTNEFSSAECSQPQPTSKVIVGRGHDGVAAPADAVARFQHDGGEAGVFQRVRGAEARGAGTDDGDIDFGGERHDVV